MLGRRCSEAPDWMLRSNPSACMYANVYHHTSQRGQLVLVCDACAHTSFWGLHVGLVPRHQITFGVTGTSSRAATAAEQLMCELEIDRLDSCSTVLLESICMRTRACTSRTCARLAHACTALWCAP